MSGPTVEPTRDALTILGAVSSFASLLSAYIVSTDPGTVRPALVLSAGTALHNLAGLLPLDVDRRPLPYPATSAETPHSVTFPLAAGEFACLEVLADRWGTTPDLAACTVLCLDLLRRHMDEESAARRGKDAEASG